MDWCTYFESRGFGGLVLGPFDTSQQVVHIDTTTP